MDKIKIFKGMWNFTFLNTSGYSDYPVSATFPTLIKNLLYQVENNQLMLGIIFFKPSKITVLVL